MGLGTALFRASWEIRTRLPSRANGVAVSSPGDGLAWTRRLPFADAAAVADAVRDRIPRERLESLRAVAEGEAHGKILCFGRWIGDYGDPIDWHRDPRSGAAWPADVPGLAALRAAVGDPKLTWEAARFPQAYRLARAAAFFPERRPTLSEALAGQIDSFVTANPYGRGIHWSSGQEIAVRMRAWTFALDACLVHASSAESAARTLAQALGQGAHHIERGFDYALHAVNNNHLLSEALGLYLAGVLLPPGDAAVRWRARGRRTLEEEAERQFYADGAYLNLSHTYHRNVLQMLLWACVLARSEGDRPSHAWLAALDRSIDFLTAQQCPTDGRLPNFGPNDGSHPSLLSTCDFTDLRPTLQAASILVRGERLYDAGPWDEEAAWWLGPAALDAPLRPPVLRSRAFEATGFYVLRGRDPRTFVTFRCGTLRDRHGQMDMLHTDVFWRGVNVLVDGGSYLYGGPPAWHAHFHGTASHNTVTVDGHDQMLHVRQFRHLYWTRAERLAFEERPGLALVAGEHYAYERHPGRCVHRRAVLLADELVVVVDRVAGEGEHRLRLHWLLGELPVRREEGLAQVALETSEGRYAVAVFGEQAEPEKGSVVAGQEDPPHGWMSRYYGEKVAVPSLAVDRRARVPWTWVTVMGPGSVRLVREGEKLVATCEGARVAFRLNDGIPAVDEEARA